VECEKLDHAVGCPILIYYVNCAYLKFKQMIKKTEKPVLLTMILVLVTAKPLLAQGLPAGSPVSELSDPEATASAVDKSAGLTTRKILTIQRLGGLFINHSEMAIKRLVKILTRMQSRIGKMEIPTKEKPNLNKAIDMATDNLEAAQIALNKFRISLASLYTKQQTKSELTTLRLEMNTIREDLHKTLAVLNGISASMATISGRVTPPVTGKDTLLKNE